MKILHTADLHLGRQFNGISLDSDFAAILDQIADAVADHRADVLVIAGDIFDRAAPPASAVRQFNAFLSRVASETNAAVVMIAGNHDSSDRIASMSIMTDTRRAHIRGALDADEKPFIIHDEHGPVAFSGLPFGYEYAARECFGDEAISTPEHVLAAQVAAARRNLPENARWIIVAHAFVTGAVPSDSERSLTRVGGIETVQNSLFEGAHYVALGHIHKAQTAGGPHIRYSGSPLAFGFDEAESAKIMHLVEIDASGNVAVEDIAFRPIRSVRVLRGKHAELLLGQPTEDFIKVLLTDETPVIDAMKRLRVLYPNACELSYERHERAPEIKSFSAAAHAAADPLEVIGDFLEAVRGTRLSDSEQEIVGSGLGRLREKEDAQ